MTNTFTDTFAGWLIHTGVIDGVGGLGKAAKDYREYRDSRDWNERMLSFTDYLEQKYPDQWIAYQAYIRLIN